MSTVPGLEESPRRTCCESGREGHGAANRAPAHPKQTGAQTGGWHQQRVRKVSGISPLQSRDLKQLPSISHVTGFYFSQQTKLREAGAKH